MQKWYKNVEITLKNWKFPIKNEKNRNFVKHACQNMVAMEMSKCSQINFRKSHQIWGS